MKNVILLIIAFSFLISCEKKTNHIDNSQAKKSSFVKPEKQDAITAISPSTSYGKEFNDNEKMKTLSEKIRKKGDTIAYNELRYIYWYSGHVAEFLPYSLIMAEDYKYPIAYFHCYKEMNLLSHSNPKSKDWAKYYLLVANEKKVRPAKYEVDEIFGKSIPDSKNYWFSLKKWKLQLTGVWQDWGFSGIFIFNHIFVQPKYSVSKFPNLAKRQNVVGNFENMDDINFKQIRFYVLGIFIIIFGLLIWFSNTNYYLKKDYLDFKKVEFRATVAKKFDEHPVRGNKIYLNNGPELIVRRELFDKLEIGDTIIKKAGCDSIFFKTYSGVLIDDYNGFKRKKYLNSLK